MAVNPAPRAEATDVRPAAAHAERRGTADRLRRSLPLAALTGCALIAGIVGTIVTAYRPIPGVLEPGTVIHYGLPIVRILLEIGAVVTVGLSLLPKLLGFDRPEHTEPVMRPARRAAVFSALLWAVCALLAIVLQTAELHPGHAVAPGLIVDYVRQVGSGQGLLASGSLAGVSLGFALLAVRHGESIPAELRIVVSLFALLPIPVTGHASNWRWHDLSMISMELHVVGAATWTGGLLALTVLLAGRRRLLAEVLPRFSRLATVCLVLVAVTGTINGLTELLLTPGLAFPSGLFTSGYGRLVLAKIGCLAALAVLGANIRWRLLPSISRGASAAFLGWAGTEVAVMGAAYGLGVVLSRSPVLPS